MRQRNIKTIFDQICGLYNMFITVGYTQNGILIIV